MDRQGNRLDTLKVLLTVGIVLRHATTSGLPDATAAFSTLTQGIIALTEVCVPLFFVISGYLFFHNVPEKPAGGWFLQKYKSRFFTLVLPYLIANVIAFGCFWFAHHVTPSLMSGFLGEQWKDPLFIFWKGPVNLSLWFIRELIVVVVLSPFVYLLVRYLRWWGVLGLGVLWALKIAPAPLFFFSLGACLACWKIAPVEQWLLTGSRTPVSSRAWTYFVYLYHYLLLIGIKKYLGSALSPQGTAAQLAVYLVGFLLTLCLLTAAYALLRRWIPGVLKVLVGGK